MGGCQDGHARSCTWHCSSLLFHLFVCHCISCKNSIVQYCGSYPLPDPLQSGTSQEKSAVHALHLIYTCKEASDRESYKDNMFMHPSCVVRPSNEQRDEPSLARSILSPRAYSCASGRVWRRVRRTKSSGWVVGQSSGQCYKIREKNI